MRLSPIRTLGSAALLAAAFAFPATGHCTALDTNAIAASSASPAPAPNTLLLIAAALAFPAAMLAGACIAPKDHTTPSSLE